MKPAQLLLLVLPACEPTGVRPIDTGEPPAPEVVTFGPSALDLPECPMTDSPVGVAERAPECRLSRPLGTPVLRWRSPPNTWSTGIVAPLVDTNADGKADEADAPTVVTYGLGAPEHTLRLLRGDTGEVVVDALIREPIGLLAPVAADVDAMTSGPELYLESRTWSAAGFRPASYGRAASQSVTRLRPGAAPVLINEGGIFDATHALTAFDGWIGLPVVADLDGEGVGEIVHLGGILNADGSSRCAWTGLDEIPSLAVMDIDADGMPEVLGLRALYGVDGWEYSIVALDGACLTKEEFRFPRSGIAVGFVESAADFDGDGEPEVALGVTKVRSDSSTRNEFGVAVMELDGTIRWVRYGVDQLYTAADLDGDGAFEVIGPDVLDGRTGELLFSLPDAYGDVLPVDVDLDGELELVAQESVAGVNYVVVYEGDPGWAPGPTIWNQEAYNGFNILPDGTLPDPPVPHWKTANTWRAATGQQQLRGIGSDLTVRLTEDCCDASGLRFGAQVGNIGHQDVMRPVELQVWGLRGEERYLLKTQVLPEVPAGSWMPGIDVRVRREARFDDVEVTVGPQGWRIEECDASNNAVRVGQACDGS